MRGFEGERLLSDSSLFPVYEEAQRLDLPICIHAGTGNFGYYDQFGQDVFSRFKLPSVGAFNNLIYQGVPEKFPKLRIAALEACCGWVPFLMDRLDEEFEKRGSREAPLLKKKPAPKTSVA